MHLMLFLKLQRKKVLLQLMILKTEELLAEMDIIFRLLMRLVLYQKSVLQKN